MNFLHNQLRFERSLRSSISGRARGAFLAAVLLVMISATGCSTILGKSTGPLDKLDPTGLKLAGYTMGPHGLQRPLPVDGNESAIILEVVDGKRHFEKVPLAHGQPMFVADLVRDAELRKKLGRIKVKVLRPNGSKAPVRMDVDFDDSGKHIMEGMNYSLRPGDHVVVTPDDRAILTSMLGSNIFSKK